MIVKDAALRSRWLRVIFHDRFHIASILDSSKLERHSFACRSEAHHNELALLVGCPRVCRIDNFVSPKVVITDLHRIVVRVSLALEVRENFARGLAHHPALPESLRVFRVVFLARWIRTLYLSQGFLRAPCPALWTMDGVIELAHACPPAKLFPGKRLGKRR